MGKYFIRLFKNTDNMYVHIHTHNLTAIHNVIILSLEIIDYPTKLQC